MKVAYKNSLYYKVLKRIRSLRGSTILRPDLTDLGGERQVSRALKKLAAEKKIVRLGYGVYGKLTRSSFDPSITYLDGGFLSTAREALTKLNVKWEPSRFEKDYNSGQSTQVPANPPTKINTRFSRKLIYNNKEFKIE